MMDELDFLEEQGKKEREEKKKQRKSPQARQKKNYGRAQRNRGLKVEREMAKRLSRFGFERVPLSGAMGGSWSGDLRRMKMDGRVVGKIEVKRRENSFKTLEDWLTQGGGVDVVIIDPAYGREELVVMHLSIFEKLLEEAGYDGGNNDVEHS